MLEISKLTQINQVASSLVQATTMDIGIGLVSNADDWNKSMRIFPNVEQGNAESRSLNTLQTTVGNPRAGAYSLASALITIVLHGSSELFKIPESAAYYLDMVRIVVFCLNYIVFRSEFI